MTRASDGRVAHVACGGASASAGCGATLAYPSGAPFVRCALCDHVTRTDANVEGESEESQCDGCGTTMRHARGAMAVRCGRCGTITARGTAAAGGGADEDEGPVRPRSRTSAETSRVRCDGCRCTLAYPAGAAAVRCAACGTVTRCETGAGRADGGRADDASAARGGPATTALTMENMVVVENPPTLTVDGRVVSNIAVGVKLDD